MAAAQVRAFQANDLAIDNTLLAWAKHFVAYCAVEGGRDYNTVDISDGTLREIYLPPFQSAVQDGTASVMTAFNEDVDRVSGIHQHDLTDWVCKWDLLWLTSSSAIAIQAENCRSPFRAPLTRYRFIIITKTPVAHP